MVIRWPVVRLTTTPAVDRANCPSVAIVHATGCPDLPDTGQRVT
jgi:hypothetical protein